MTALIIVSIAASSAVALAIGGRVRDEDRLRGEDVADLAQAVHDERGTGRHEVDDPLGQAEPRRDLDGTRDRDDVDGDAPVGEESARGVRMGGRDSQAGELLDAGLRRVVGDRRGEPAATVAELADAWQLGTGLGQEVDPGDPEVGDPVADELDDVVRAHEEDVEVEVLDARDEAAVVLLEDEAGIVQQAQGRFDQAALVGDRQPEALVHVPASRIARVLSRTER